MKFKKKSCRTQLKFAHVAWLARTRTKPDLPSSFKQNADINQKKLARAKNYFGRRKQFKKWKMKFWRFFVLFFFQFSCFISNNYISTIY